MVWTHKEARPRLRWKKHSGDGTTWEKKERKTEAEMDGLCQPGHESHRNNNNEFYDRTGWRKIVYPAASYNYKKKKKVCNVDYDIHRRLLI